MSLRAIIERNLRRLPVQAESEAELARAAQHIPVTRLKASGVCWKCGVACHFIACRTCGTPLTMEEWRQAALRHTLKQSDGVMLAACRKLQIAPGTAYQLKARMGMVLLALCLGIAAAEAQPTLPQKMLPRSISAPLRTNGVQWLRWKAGAAPQTLVISTNVTVVIPDESYLARISGLANGTKQTYVVTNAFGESNIAIATVFQETNRIEDIGRIYRVPLYPNMSNWLVTASSPDSVTWTPEKFLGTNGTAVFYVTNTGPQKFYRVKAL